MSTFADFSNDMANLVESVGASLVRVEARRRMATTGIIWNADGVIITSHHGVTRDENIHVGLPDGTTVPAALVGRDPSTDIAILKAELNGLPVPTWATSNDARVGHVVLALGRPGKTVQASLGVISALGNAYQAHGGGKIDRYLQADLVMYPGFSGGALVGADGKVFGMNTSALMRGASITVPTETLTRIAQTLIEHGHIKRGYLGVTAQTVRLPETAVSGQETGLLIASVEAKSPAEESGLMLGDVIVQMADQPMRSMEDLLALLNSGIVGETLSASILRGGELRTLSVTIRERN